MTFSNYWELKTRQAENRGLSWWDTVESRGCQCLFAELEWSLGPAKSKEEMEESVAEVYAFSGQNYNTRPRHCTSVEVAGWKQRECLTNNLSVWMKDTLCLWQLCAAEKRRRQESCSEPLLLKISNCGAWTAEISLLIIQDQLRFPLFLNRRWLPSPFLHITSPLHPCFALLRRMPVTPG